MIVSEKEYESMFITIGDNTYSPKANLIIENNNEEVIFKYEIIKTAQQVYEELSNPQPTKPSTEDKTTHRLDQQEEAIGVLATQLAKNTLLQNQGGF